MIALTFLSVIAIGAQPPEWTGKELRENSQLVLKVSLDTKTPYTIALEKFPHGKTPEYSVQLKQKNKARQNQVLKEAEFTELYEKFRLFAVETGRVIPMAPKTCQYPMTISLKTKDKTLHQQSICTDFFGATENKRYQEWIESATLGMAISRRK